MLLTYNDTTSQQNIFPFVALVKRAVEKQYGVNVEKVNTMVVMGKKKTRYTKAGVLAGRKPSYKKAIVTLAEGEVIDFYSNV